MALVTSTEMFKKAYNGGYAIGAFNVNNMEIIQGITEAAIEKRAPLILQVSKGARAYAKHVYLMKLIEAAIEDAEQTAGFDLPIVVHLDHGDTFELCKSCIDGGFTSVMIDGSSKSFEDNIALTRQVVEYAHDHGVVVEGELGTLAGVEDEVKVSAEDSSYTRPDEVEEFVNRTGVDSLAIAIGTSHGAYKFTAAQCTRNEKGILVPPPLRFDILDEVAKRLPGFPIVLHGSSSVPQEFVKIINENGGKYNGMDRYECRKAAVEDLKALGLLVNIKAHKHMVPRVSRTGEIVEPMLSEQWYMAMSKPAGEGTRYPGKSIAEVGLEAVHAHVHQLIEVRSVPLAGIRIGEIDNRHARLPHIGLEEAAVGLFQQVAMLHAFLEQRRRLTDVRVNPAADVQPLLVVTLEHSHRVGERVMIPLEVAPVEALHPEAVKMEYTQWNISVCHSLDKGIGRLFIIVCCKGCGKP